MVLWMVLEIVTMERKILNLNNEMNKILNSPIWKSVFVIVHVITMILVFSFSASSKNFQIKIEGNISDLPAKYIYIQHALSKQIIDSSKCKLGLFHFEFIIKEFEPLFVSLFFKSENNKKTLISFRNNFISNNTKEYKTTAFYLDTGTTFINGKFIEIINSGPIMNPVSLIGSKTQNEPFFLTQLIDFALIDSRSDSIFRAKEVETMIGWIKHYPQSFWFMNRVYANKRFFSSAELVKLYNLFDSKVQNSNQGKLLIDFATNSGQINFNFNQVIGKDSISLNQSLIHDNKPSLIIFWASWCAPCRNEIPYLKSLYKKFSNSINFASVSIDKNEDNWKSAIRIEKMPWQQLIVSESESLQLMKLLHFDSIPFMILVDSSANIISNYNEGFFELPNKRLESNISKLLN